MTDEELVEFILLEQKEKTEIRYIKAHALERGVSGEQFEKVLEIAHTRQQQIAEKDPALRLLLGPTLVIIACVFFYTEWAGRSVGPASFLGALCMYLGLRLLYSLVKQYRK